MKKMIMLKMVLYLGPPYYASCPSHDELLFVAPIHTLQTKKNWEVFATKVARLSKEQEGVHRSIKKS